MNATPDREIDVYDMLDELTRPHHHDITVDRDPDAVTGTSWSYRHRVHTPSLLDQLDDPTPTATEDAGGARGFESQAPVHLECLDLLAAIDHEAGQLAGADMGSTAATVRRAGAKLGTLHRCGRPHGKPACCDWHDAEHQIRGWWAQARVVAGWDESSWRPNATCPACGRRGGLRIRTKDRIGTCIECRETWHTGTIELLGRHIRDETLAAAVANRRSPCEVVEGYEPHDFDHLCPACGRTRCQRAVTLALTCPSECDSRRCGRVAAVVRRAALLEERRQAAIAAALRAAAS